MYTAPGVDPTSPAPPEPEPEKPTTGNEGDDKKPVEGGGGDPDSGFTNPGLNDDASKETTENTG